MLLLLWVLLEGRLGLVLLGLGLVHFEVVLLVLLVLLLLQSARLLVVVFRDGLLGVRLAALGFGQVLCFVFVWVLCRFPHSPMAQSGVLEGCGLASRPGVRALLVGIRVFPVMLLADSYLGRSLWKNVVFFLFVTAAITDEGVHCGRYCRSDKGSRGRDQRLGCFQTAFPSALTSRRSSGQRQDSH